VVVNFDLLECRVLLYVLEAMQQCTVVGHAKGWNGRKANSFPLEVFTTVWTVLWETMMHLVPWWLVLQAVYPGFVGFVWESQIQIQTMNLLQTVEHFQFMNYNFFFSNTNLFEDRLGVIFLAWLTLSCSCESCLFLGSLAYSYWEIIPFVFSIVVLLTLSTAL